MIRKVFASDLLAISKIHVEALPDDLLPGLGVGFLSKIFYPTCLKSAENIFLVFCDKKDTVSAFVVFANNTNKLTQKVLSFKCALFFYLLKALILHPSFIKKTIAYFVGFKLKLNAGLSEVDIASYPEIYIIAAANDSQGLGYGSALLGEGLACLRKRECRGCLVRTSSVAAKRFYLKRGFKKIGEEYRGNIKMDILIIDF